MAKESSSNSSPDDRDSIRRQDGKKLPEYVNQQLRDAVWAGLAQKMQADKKILCKKHGHQWINGPSNTVICARCKVQKMTTEEV